MKLMKT